MKTTVIISVYKDVKALAIILSALQRQTYSNFDIIISEDGECLEMKESIQQYNNTTIQQYNNTTIQQYNNTNYAFNPTRYGMA